MKVIIQNLNETYAKVVCPVNIAVKLSDVFSYKIDKYWFSPAYRDGRWDGKIRLFNASSGRIFKGLVPRILTYLESLKSSVSVDNRAEFRSAADDRDMSSFLETLKLPKDIRDYQRQAIDHGICAGRASFLSPTASGKSLVIYVLSQWHVQVNRRVLIVVPTLKLVNQMHDDFVEYGCDSSLMSMIKAGEDKEVQTPITISTWQSIYKLPEMWFRQFDVVIGDEMHLFTAKSLQELMRKMVSTAFRYGFTGTLDDSKIHQLVLEGLFGPVLKVSSTVELIDQNYISDLRIQFIHYRYDLKICKRMMDLRSYHDEIEQILSYPPRLDHISNLVRNCEGKTLVLVRHVDKHAVLLHDTFKEKLPDCRVFLYTGKLTIEPNSASMGSKDVIVATYGVFQQGVNIPDICNVILASPSKSRVRVLQSIGRGLRLAEGKSKCYVFDLVDDFRIGHRKNYLLKMYEERKRIYTHEGFVCGETEVRLEELPGGLSESQ